MRESDRVPLIDPVRDSELESVIETDCDVVGVIDVVWDTVPLVLTVSLSV